MKSSEDIIRGLEVCSRPGRSCCSDECPYYKQNTNCTSIELKQDALALILAFSFNARSLADHLFTKYMEKYGL